jgi:hypothetical protein
MIAPRQKVNILVRKFAPKKSLNEVNSNTNGTEINNVANEKKYEEKIDVIPENSQLSINPDNITVQHLVNDTINSNIHESSDVLDTTNKPTKIDTLKRKSQSDNEVANKNNSNSINTNNNEASQVILPTSSASLSIQEQPLPSIISVSFSNDIDNQTTSTHNRKHNNITISSEKV